MTTNESLDSLENYNRQARERSEIIDRLTRERDAAIARAEAAEADNAAFLDDFISLQKLSVHESTTKEQSRIFIRIYERAHPGSALLAELSALREESNALNETIFSQESVNEKLTAELETLRARVGELEEAPIEKKTNGWWVSLIIEDFKQWWPLSEIGPELDKLRQQLAASEEARGKAVGKCEQAIRDALDNYRSINTECADDGSPLGLVDLLTPSSDRLITRGKEEIESLADYIASAVEDALAAQPDAQAEPKKPEGE